MREVDSTSIQFNRELLESETRSVLIKNNLTMEDVCFDFKYDNHEGDGIRGIILREKITKRELSGMIWIEDIIEIKESN